MTLAPKRDFSSGIARVRLVLLAVAALVALETALPARAETPAADDSG